MGPFRAVFIAGRLDPGDLVPLCPAAAGPYALFGPALAVFAGRSKFKRKPSAPPDGRAGADGRPALPELFPLRFYF